MREREYQLSFWQKKADFLDSIDVRNSEDHLRLLWHQYDLDQQAIADGFPQVAVGHSEPEWPRPAEV